MADNSAEKNSDSERDERVKKLEALTSVGLVAYPAKVERDYEIAAVLSDFAKHEKAAKDFNIVGRLRAKREHGNLVFANLEDASGSMQLVVSKKDLGADSFKNFIKFIDVADFIQVSGHCFVTARGEQSLMVVDWKLLTKALLPIPDAWYGLKNEDERLRKRYLDLLLNPELKELFRQKSRFWEVTREFMKVMVSLKWKLRPWKLPLVAPKLILSRLIIMILIWMFLCVFLWVNFGKNV